MTLRDFVRLIGPMGPMTQTKREAHAETPPRPPAPARRVVLDAGRTLAPKDGQRFFGLEVATMLGRERSTVYKSLHRLVDLGLSPRRVGRRAPLLPAHRLRPTLVVRGLLGARVFGRTDDRLRRVRAMAA